MTRQIVVDVIGDSSKLNKATDSAVAHAGGLTTKLQGIGKGMVIGTGIAAFDLLKDAISTGIEKLGEAHQAFLDDQESQEKLGQSLKNNIPHWNGNTDAVEAYAHKQAELGFSADSVRDSLGQLVGITHDQADAQNLTNVAMDLARAKGLDLATATDVVTKAAQGNGKALKSLGIDTTGAHDAASLLNDIQKNVNGSAETWANTNKGKLAVSNESVHESMVKVGAIIDKVSQVAIPIFAAALSFVVDVLGNVIHAIEPVVREIAHNLEPVFKALLPVAQQVFGGIVTVVKALAPVIGAVFGAIGTVIGVAIKIWQTQFGLLGTALGVLGNVFKSIATIVGNVFGTIGGIIRGAINAVIGIINSAIDAINGIQVHIHVGPVGYDFDGLNIGHIPRLHTGGVVPGAFGSEQLAVLQAGELVTPANKINQQGMQIHVHGNIYGISGVDELSDLIADRLRLAGA